MTGLLRMTISEYSSMLKRSPGSGTSHAERRNFLEKASDNDSLVLTSSSVQVTKQYRPKSIVNKVKGCL